MKSPIRSEGKYQRDSSGSSSHQDEKQSAARPLVVSIELIELIVELIWKVNINGSPAATLLC